MGSYLLDSQNPAECDLHLYTVSKQDISCVSTISVTCDYISSLKYFDLFSIRSLFFYRLAPLLKRLFSLLFAG